MMTFEEIFLMYGIHPKFWAGMQACAMADAKPDILLEIRLLYAENYRNCLRDLKAAGTRSHPINTPATVPFQSIEVNDEQSNRFSGPPDSSGRHFDLSSPPTLQDVDESDQSDQGGE